MLLDNHGVIVGEPPELGDDGFTQELRWIGHDGSLQLRETRAISWSALDERTWKLTFETALSADSHAELNSPGSKGRIGGGYGGFFWRFPACEDVEVFTSAARGEDEVHGSVAPWVAWSADFAAGPGVSGPATIVIRAPDASAAGEPWFVRVQQLSGSRVGAGLGSSQTAPGRSSSSTLLRCGDRGRPTDWGRGRGLAAQLIAPR